MCLRLSIFVCRTTTRWVDLDKDNRLTKNSCEFKGNDHLFYSSLKNVNKKVNQIKLPYLPIRNIYPPPFYYMTPTLSPYNFPLLTFQTVRIIITENYWCFKCCPLKSCSEGNRQFLFYF